MLLAANAVSEARRYGDVTSMGWFSPLFLHLFLKLCSSGLKLIQSLLQSGHFLLDLAQLCLVFTARQVVRPKLRGNVLLKLTPQKPEIGIPPYCPLSVFKPAGLNASYDEVLAHSICNRSPGS